MNRICFAFLLGTLLFCIRARAQEVPAGLHDSLFSTYYQQRVSLFRTLPVKPGATVFLGNSITDGGEWDELFGGDPAVINRGISGDVTSGVLNRLREVTDRKPAKIFLLIGTNDLARGITVDSVLKNIFLTARIIRKESPATRLYVQSLTPVNNLYNKFAGHTKNAAKIRQVNQALKDQADFCQYTYIDLHPVLGDREGKLKASLSNDGLHLLGDAYQLWAHRIYPYVYDLSPRPALLPLPQDVSWGEGVFPLYRCSGIVIADDSLRQVAATLRDFMEEKGVYIPVTERKELDHAIELSIDRHLKEQHEEAYEIRVTEGKVVLKAATLHGLFNGVQTLRQLMRSGAMMDVCVIKDRPAFDWRGYMVDVGRNYQSVELLKQQIDQMAGYKLNVFHFHATEDVAWRWESKKYPELTAAANMTRDAGLFYSGQDIKELIEYCRDRFITFVPEIDMPGHSAAFKRAMGFDMQSDSGKQVVQELLLEICRTYPSLSYLHLGGDEVKIRDSSFLPQMESLLVQQGKKVMGWRPGGNFSGSVIRQLWGDDDRSNDGDSRFEVDSRNLYINHMDAQESVVSIFNHQMNDVLTGDDRHLGGILCLWNDRNLNTGEDNLTHNPVYPAMLAFAERTWRGGGYGTDNRVGLYDTLSRQYQDFCAFEDRLVDIKKTFFAELPFSYVKQQNIHWQLIGPFDNKGDLSASFAPERVDFDFDGISNHTTVSGATVILRHFWHPVIKGVLPDPKENSTYYAYARYYSQQQREALMWIGFYDYSRSSPMDPPRPGTWDNLGSGIWVNGTAVGPPHWQRGGQKGSLEIPLVDENYSLRKPARVRLKKGWNTVLVKLPVGKFNSGLWYAPVKWMFTGVFVKEQPGSMNFQQDAELYSGR